MIFPRRPQGIKERQTHQGMREPAWLASTIRRRAFGEYHPVGTCRMGGQSDLGAVVDSDCTVHGVDGLSVVDASMMPSIPRGNTNIPVIMIAEHASERIAKQNGSDARYPGKRVPSSG
jgi:choline dehydrogenase-like flavoprotein